MTEKRITIELVTQAYRKIKDEVEELEAQIKEKKEVMKRQEDWLLAKMDYEGVNSSPNDFGTPYIAVDESVTSKNWDATLEWVKEGDRWEYLNHSIKKTAVLEYMGKERENPPPPGVDYSAVRRVRVRAPSKK